MKSTEHLFLIFIILAIFTACSKQEEKAIHNIKNSYTEASIGDAQRLIPMLASDSASGSISSLVFNGLVKYDKDLNLEGDLAESWLFSDDCREIIFNLRQNVKWHDGHNFTADDVLFTYHKLVDDKVATPYRGDFERIQSVEVIDNHKIKIVYKDPFSPGISSWVMGIIPKHLLEYVDINTAEFNRKPVGTGPYVFHSWSSGQNIILTAYDNYYDGKPNIENYIYRVIPDSATMFLELKSGGIDSMGLTPIQYERQTKSELFKNNFNKFKYPSFGYTYIGYNLKDTRFSDIKVRQALGYAIDKQAIINGVLLGLGRIATGPFPPESWAYNKNVRIYDHNPQKAAQLLKEAGWSDTDGDGIIDKNGIPFSFTIITNQGNDERRKTAEIIQQGLKKIGINVQITILEWQTMLHQFIHKKKFEAVILGWGLGRDPDLYDIWHSSKTEEGEFNFISYNNPEVDKLLIDGRTTCNQEKRREIYLRIHELIAEDQPYTFLYYPESLPIVHKRFKGIEPSALGIFYNFPKWYIEQ